MPHTNKMPRQIDEAFFFVFVSRCYLVGDGFAFEFDIFEFDFIVFDALDELVVAVFDTVVVPPLVVVAVFDTDVVALEFEVVVLARLVLVLFAVSPPQAAPNAANPKSAESAIAFFM